MPTNDFVFTTDDYDLYSGPGDTEAARPGSPNETEPDMYFPLSTTPKSTMDQDPNNTGPTNDFWTEFPLSIDINGFIFYNGENTGINVRGPAGASNLHWDDLTEQQRQTLKGAPGANGINGQNGTNGINGTNGLDAYHLWLQEEGYTEQEHPIEDFWDFLAGRNTIVIAGVGDGSLLTNYRGIYSSATGDGATALGKDTQANGVNSIAGGLSTIAGHPMQVVFGRFNNNSQNNIFEIGNGTAGSPINVFNITYSGNVQSAGTITDGTGNILSNKVDKEVGKQLSTYDFNATYKGFIDNYTVDTSLSNSSTNPVENRVIKAAIDNANAQNTKPTQSSTTANTNFKFLFASNTSEAYLNEAKFTDTFTWNPNKGTLNTNNNSTNSHNNVFLFGKNLAAAANNQVIFGKYNETSATDVFQIGNGIAEGSGRNNLFTISNDGDVTAAGDIVDGSGNVLSAKQDILQYDTVPTQNSTKLVNSGNLYSYINTNVLNQITSINSTIATMQGNITTNANNISTLTTTVNNLLHPILITDEQNNRVYSLGIKNGKLYIQLVQESEPEEEEEEEESET